MTVGIINPEEESYLKENEYGYYEIIREFDKLTYYQFHELFDSSKTFQDNFYILKKLVYSTNNVKLFYEILETFDYSKKADIIDNIKIMCSCFDIRSINKVRKYCLSSPYINDIIIGNDCSTFIFNTIYGSFKVHSLLGYLNVYELNSKNIFTANIELPFGGEIRKTYIKDNDDYIIDVENNLVLDENNFIELYNPSGILNVDNNVIAK